MHKVGDWINNSDLATRRCSLHDIVAEYIINPSILRNKIAHGQWDIALNRDNTKENEDLTIKLGLLNVIDITRWFEVHQYLGLIIRDLIQSPQKGFHNNYWVNLVKLEQYLLKSKEWTIDSKRAQLQRKPLINTDNI